MRKFIVSDLHGNGDVYNSIMNYLDDIKKEEDIELYINGDLIDRGMESVSMLLDVKRRIEDGENIIYLAGNHEQMMYDVFEKRRKDMYVPPYDDWFLNGGRVTDSLLENTLGNKDKILEVVDFISNLKLYHKFIETMNEKPIVLVHASCPINVKDECDIYLYDKSDTAYYTLWTREYDPDMPFRCRIGHDSYFTIVGHNPNNNQLGVEYHLSQEYLNIDGGCAKYANGLLEYDHVPLVEVCDNLLKILTFNHHNEIIYGNYFHDNKFFPYTVDELNKERERINRNKELIK